MKYFFKLLLCLLLPLFTACGENGTKFTDPHLLMSAFDLCPYWYDGMNWNDFRAKRNRQENIGLSRYVDKIQQQEIAKEHGVLVPNTYIASNVEVPIIDELKKHSTYVAKATHMSFSGGLVIVKNGVDIITGKPVTPEEVQEKMFGLFHERARDVESWALHQVKPGFIVQEYIPKRQEVKIQTVWGKAVVGEWRGGEKQTSTTPVYGSYDRAGNIVRGTKPAPKFWPQAIVLAEKLAQKTDALRIDFLIDDRTEPERILLNEMEIWPESNWSGMFEELATRLNDGYRGKCKPIGK